MNTINNWAKGFAFIFLSSLLVVTASERVYWYLGGVGFEQNIVIALFYMIPTLALLWVVGSGGSTQLHQMILAGAVFGFVVEGVLTTVVYEDGPLPIMAALFVGWHGLLSVVAFWFLARKWLLERRRGRLAIGAALVGLYWGIWSIAYLAPDALSDFEEDFAVMEPSEFALYALVVGAVFAAAHWLIGYVWPQQWRPGVWGRRGIVALLVAYAALAVLPTVPWAPIKFAILVGGSLWLLRRSREREPGQPSAIASLQGQVALLDTTVLLIGPLVAAAAYASVWSLEPSAETAESIFTLFSMSQMIAGLIAFVWAARRSLQRSRVADEHAPVGA